MGITLDEFLGMTQLPTSDDLASLCDTLGITFGTREDGSPILKVCAENKEEGVLIARLLGREPWRSRTIVAKKLACVKPVPVEASAELEILSCDGKVAPAPQDWKPDSGNLPNPTAMYWRSVGEMGWSVIVLKRKSP